MKKRTLNLKIIFVAVALLFSIHSNADEPENTGGDVDDTGMVTAPIDSQIPIVLFLAVGLGIFIISRKNNQNQHTQYSFKKP